MLDSFSHENPLLLLKGSVHSSLILSWGKHVLLTLMKGVNDICVIPRDHTRPDYIPEQKLGIMKDQVGTNCKTNRVNDVVCSDTVILT